MVEYHQLVKKPQVSAWICLPRRLKVILLCASFGFVIGMIIHVAEVGRNFYEQVGQCRLDVSQISICEKVFRWNVFHWFCKKEDRKCAQWITGEFFKRNTSLMSIYNLQASMGEMLDLELKYLPKANKSDEWKETSVPQGHIFSAYLDTRPEQILEERHAVNENETTWAMIRIIAILDTDMTDADLTCVYKYKGNELNGEDVSFVLSRRKATRVKPVAIDENFGLRYAAFFVLCDLTVSNGMNYDEFYNDGHLPYEITIAPSNLTDFDQLRNDSFVPIRYSESGVSMAEYSNDFMAVCVQVFHHNYDRVMSLIEFIEFYRMMGVGQFTFYNSSISPRVSQVLDYYSSEGVVTVLPWKLPGYLIFEKTIRVEGIFAALNDCLYRSSFHKSYTYVAAVDVDEFIVPRRHDDFLSMMQYLDPPGPDLRPNPQASFLFRNMFFYLMLEDDPVTLPPDTPKLFTQSKTTRWTEANPGRERSKLIVRSRQTVELGNHHTWELRRTASAFRQRYKEVEVDLEVAASQHYRTCETYEDTCWQRPTVRDRTAHRFTRELGNRVAAKCKDIFKEGCPRVKTHGLSKYLEEEPETLRSKRIEFVNRILNDE